jgi:hypothetical protein
MEVVFFNCRVGTKVAPAPVYSYIFYNSMQRVRETIFLALRLIAAVAAGARFGLRHRLPEQVGSSLESRTREIVVAKSII